MDEKLVIKKIQALLHDPPEKPIILGRVGHEGRAKEIMGGIIDDTRIPDEVRTADHIASAADRINLPKDQYYVSDFLKTPVIVHPLSGRQFDLKGLTQLELADITSSVDRSIVYLAEKYKGNYQTLYLALWRELVDRLIDEDKGKSRLGQLWELLPADTRIPDHSIWEHKRITSAIIGALPTPAFLLFAIGPVQEFIATARKTQDLWAGSYLLSYLSWSAMKVVADIYGPDSIIFPDLCRQPITDLWLKEKGLEISGKIRSEEFSSPTLPNRFLAIVPDSSVADIADKAKKAVKGTFHAVCQPVKEKMARALAINSNEWETIWKRQTEDFIETYWASSTVDNYTDFLSYYKSLMNIHSEWKFEKLLKEYEEKGFTPNIGTVYGQIYRLTEKALGSRKSLRNFNQQDEPNYKCTLCGVREPVHPGIYNSKNCSEDFGALRGFWQESVMTKFPQIRKSERLCGVCVTKRLSSKHYFVDELHFDIADNFPSVSMVATSAFKLRVIENISYNNLAVKVDQFVKAVQGLVGERWLGIPMPMVIHACRDEISKDFARLEGDWLYKEAFDDKKTLWEENKKRLKDDENTFNQLLYNVKEKAQDLFAAIKEFDKGKEKDKQIGRPSTYYAVVLMDGDNMGKWLSGENAPEIEKILHPSVRAGLYRNWDEFKKMERPLNPSLHLATSKALRDFSLKVAREIVEKDHRGKLVYAGGDDVLAFVNLRDLPEVMRKLRAYFTGNLDIDTERSKVDINFKDGSGFIPLDEQGEPINIGSGKAIKGFMLSMGTTASASMGVVIAHHSGNLSQVLDEVRKCEKKAKKLSGKNAFCITLAKRAGGTEDFSAHWHYGGDYYETIPLLRKWADAFYNGYISPKFVYTFRTETEGLEGLPPKAIELELTRVADRQRNKKATDFNKSDMMNLVDGIMKLYTGGLSIREIGVFLSAAAFLGREENR
jgi:CRISPR-associated protein Cmr2